MERKSEIGNPKSEIRNPKSVQTCYPVTMLDDPLWYKDAAIYELHVRSFYDTNADGVGDFHGLTEKLDYLKELGVTALWLLPFYPSPLRDDGYDIADYASIHPTYGELRDFKGFLREAHRRGLAVITELVVNHTSDQHPWFQRARRSKPGSRARDLYVWSESPDKYKEARIIFKDFESSNWAWDSVAQAYYWHRFYSHQPDLNYDNAEVQEAVMRVLDFWLALGVDGLRLDAVPYLYEREGTNCENLPETHAFLRALRRHVDERYRNRMLLAEANQWPEDAVAYFGRGDECHMSFHFPLMPRLFMGIRMEDRFPITDILEQTPAIPESAQWALFLRNHDELTLEMVTDEERDYMYRVYAHDPKAKINLGIRRRLAPLLGNDRRRIELMNALLFSLPGTPVIYYGDEIGMGENIYLGDRNGVRTPMQWSSDRNAGFSRANPQKLYLPVIIDPEYHYETINVEAQHNNPHSLLWWMRRLLTLRTRYRAFGRGELQFLNPENRKVLAFCRNYEEEHILVVANLSRFVQHVELDLSPFRGWVPTELFGRTKFPPVGELPYFLTLSPHAFYWFALQPESIAETSGDPQAAKTLIPVLAVDDSWEKVFQGKARAALEELLPDYLKARRWFGGKARTIKSAEIAADLPLAPYAPEQSGEPKPSMIHVALVRVEYVEGDPQTYVLPLVFLTGDPAEQILKAAPHAIVARLEVRNRREQGILCDGTAETACCATLLQMIARRRNHKAAPGELLASVTPAFRNISGARLGPLEPSIVKAEQSNTSVVFGNRFILKLFRRLEPGVNPELEIGRFLTERRFPNFPAVAGALEYREDKAEPMSLAILQAFVPSSTDGWQYTLDALGRYYERVLAQGDPRQPACVPAERLLDVLDRELPPAASEMIGTYLESARLIGQRTAELHVTLASDSENPDFSPEPFSALYQRSIYQSMRNTAAQSFHLLRTHCKKLPDSVREDAQKVAGLEAEVLKRYRSLLSRKITAMRVRCHGDYHLGQLLYTGKDFFIIDFEGEPARPLSERRLKRTALKDVAGMLRSFHYAAYAALFDVQTKGTLSTDGGSAEPWADFWYYWVSVVFLKAYVEAASRGGFLPAAREELQVLLDAFLLDKAVYELGYELNNRPTWVKIPLRGILSLVGEENR